MHTYSPPCNTFCMISSLVSKKSGKFFFFFFQSYIYADDKNYWYFSKEKQLSSSVRSYTCMFRHVHPAKTQNSLHIHTV